MKRNRWQKGSVVLVALSCVTVLGIAVASFLAVSNQAMKLSNRSYAKEVSKQLAEMGLERALRSFNANTFGTWTLADGTTATRTDTIASSNYGNSGITTAINLRVDHYLDTRKATPWSVLTTYAANDFVWYRGAWYLCSSAPPANQPPSDLTYWKSAPETWNPYANYEIGNIALSGGTAYRCIAANVNQTPPNGTYWTAYSIVALSAATSYSVNDVVFSSGMPYRCIQAHTNQLPPNTTYWLSAPVIYAEGVATLPGSTPVAIKTQLRATLAPASLFPNAAGATELVNLNSTGTVDSYNSVSGVYGGSNIGSSAVLAGSKTSGNAVAITNVRVRGYVAATSASTSPHAPVWSYGTNGIVTNTASPTIPATKIDLTRVSRSPFIPQFDVQSPPFAGTLFSVSSGTPVTLGDSAVDTPASDGKFYYYTGGDLYLDTNYTLNIVGPVVIDIRPTNSGQLFIERAGKIVIANNPTASLEIHFGDRFFIYSANALGGIQNLTLDPKRCILIGSNTYNFSSYHYLASNNVNLTFYGLIYMPNAYLHIWNSGKTQNIYGALSAKNIYFAHATDLHYDTSLRTAVISGVDAPYKISEWRELTDPSERVVLP